MLLLILSIAVPVHPQCVSGLTYTGALFGDLQGVNVIQFKASGSITFPVATSVSVLLIGGGGVEDILSQEAVEGLVQ